ncbi:MAG: aminotransferase class I/II-fold pyridoxal phosphate-dependent enzyme [Luteitalea sp.]|nr:aminotransferase class I/II-fold pyridoxal phosphate-dependent enzyme [Luteitalea sp.]
MGAVTAGSAALFSRRAAGDETSAPAMLGGTAVRREPFPTWPVADTRETEALARVVRSGHWFRGSGEEVNRFEAEYGKLTGARHCLATANGTSALITALQAIGVGPGDEVIVPPYTFIATVNVVLLAHALPVFVDTDVETLQIDARKIEAAITERTRAIVPVHLGGAAADLDTILASARARNIPVVEDACQAHLGEWKGRKVGTYGRAGCFSFQASKNLNAGEGGAVLSDDGELIEACYAFHNNSRGRKTSGYDFSYRSAGANLRLTEFQAAVLMAQMTRLEAQARAREENAAYLTRLLKDVPGITTARMYEGCTRNAYHLYMFRYDAGQFAGLPRAAFLKALAAEGVPASGGYAPLNKEPFLEATLTGRGYRAIYSAAQIAELEERNRCPKNDRLCDEAVWLTQNMLLGSRGDMDQIAEAIRKIQRHAHRLATA